MHQAKVLSRKRRLIDAQIGTALEAIVGILFLLATGSAVLKFLAAMIGQG